MTHARKNLPLVPATGIENTIAGLRGLWNNYKRSQQVPLEAQIYHHLTDFLTA